MSAFAPRYHLFCNTVSAQAGAIIVSVEYGVFPIDPTGLYEDSWAALQWVASRQWKWTRPWLNDHAVSTKFFMWSHAGGNISHTLAFRRVNRIPADTPAEDLAKLGCERVLIFVAEKSSECCGEKLP
ncbi:probable carboxylesterase 1 [Pistacia vera]|uniref:probable carboxylesterase 1 n=1 Tax=Pistacia vera TaxID=55513 RepID=UPI001262EAF6|nr:probable carboxylesterase 1 [Pistacia vera]